MTDEQVPVHPRRRSNPRTLSSSRRIADGGRCATRAGELVCLSVYQRGARERVKRRSGNHYRVAAASR